jgi:hypothetical protein
MIETIWAVASPYLPAVAGFIVTHGVGWLKTRVNKEHPLLWNTMTIIGNLLLAGGVTTAMDADAAQIAINTTISQGVSQLYHSHLKTKVKKAEAKINEPKEVTPTV